MILILQSVPPPSLSVEYQFANAQSLSRRVYLSMRLGSIEKLSTGRHHICSFSMGRNRKGRQCGGYGSKKERFVLFRRWQQEVAKVSRKNAQSRQAQRKLVDQQKRVETNDAVRRRVRVDVLTAWTNARLKDDHIERVKREGALSIASELRKTSAVREFSSLQERCIYEIARSFDLYSSSCEFTQAFFASFEPWMVSRLAELTTAFKTMSDGNVKLLLLQPTEHLTIGFVRDEKSLAMLFDEDEVDHRMAWQFTSGSLLQTEAESWEDLDVEDVDIVQTQEEVQLLSLSLVSCLGLSSRFLTQLTTTHPYLEHLKIVDCFDAAAGEQGAVLLQQLAKSRALKSLHFSWCCWLTTEILVTFAYQLLEPPVSSLQELHVSDCFDVLGDYVQSVFNELLPHINSFFMTSMRVSGPLYRRTPRLFNRSKPGEWSMVWCELALEQGELLVALDPDGRSRIATIPVKDCELAHVRSDGRDCFELTVNRGKKETFSSHESSHDVDWWMTTLIAVKRDLERGVKPNISLLTPPVSEPTTRPKHMRRPSSQLSLNLNLAPTTGNAVGGAGLGRPTLRRRKPALATCETLFERFTIYETPSTYYVVCSDRHYSKFRMMELDRMVERPKKLEEVLKEDKRLYDWEQMEARLQALAELARVHGTGELMRAFTAVAIVGCIRFLRGYYFIFVTQRRKIGNIGGNSIYGISATQQLNVSPLEEDQSAWTRLNRWFNPSPEEEAEARYLGLFHFLDLTKDFYFSYSYDITHTLQHNMTTEHSEPAEMFTWNEYLTRELGECLSGGAAADLIVPLVLGCYEQRKCSVFGRLVSIVLLARRSRHFAGTRYLKRGVADTGKAANDVETEQIIEDESMGPGKFSSFVQHRGSIPVFWSQETSATLPKPPIVLNRVDPTYSATQKHFADLFSRYGSPVVALNLVKQSEKKEREVIVGNEYMNAVEYLNSFMPPDHRVRYVALDYSRLSGPKQKGLNVLHSLDKVAVWALTQTGFFCSAPKRQISQNGNRRTAQAFFPSQPTEPWDAFTSSKNLQRVGEGSEELSPEEPPPSPTITRNSGDWLEQRGILRTNCIDCLDRTNVSQFSVGMRALGQQLYVMGIKNTPLLESRSQLVLVLMKLYSLMGDAISMQYGGSEAHKNVKNSAARENVKHRELLTSIRRYYSNSFTDTAKQDAINIFLGHFVPKEDSPPLWELDSDYYLHNFEVRNGMAACENVRRNIAFHAENKRKAFGDFYGAPPMQLSCCSSSEVLDDSDGTDESDDNELAHQHAVVVANRDQAKRDAYIRECRRVLDDWWKDPLEAFEQPKYCLPSTEEKPPRACDQIGRRGSKPNLFSGSDNSTQTGAGNRKTSPRSPCSDDFLHMYHPEELTTFDKVLGYKFMLPMEISDEVNDKEKSRSESAVVAHLTSAPSSSSISGLARVDEENLSDLEQSTRRGQPTQGNRSYRSMSAPDISEEVTYSPKTHQRLRDSGRENKHGHQEDYTSISGSESRQVSRAALADAINKYGGHGSASLKGVVKRKGDQISIEDYVLSRGRRKFVGDCSTPAADPVYQQYVVGQQSPQMWESDNKSVKMYFEAYMRDNNISPDDARSLRDAQIRAGATFKLQDGPYSGLEQNVKARVLVAKKLKTQPEDRKIFEESLNLKKLEQIGESSVPTESLELYKTYFDEELPSVEIYRPTKAAAPTPKLPTDLTPPMTKRSTSATALSSELAQSIQRLSLNKKNRTRFSGGDLIAVGPLLKMDGGKDRDFIVFNEAAAENSFGEVTRNETELSFYSK
ncbi:Phosphoinositide phosphatase SAC1 [Phytophthora citrophthora]|uniref:Phosphoinositide phosphatase SAC1 n=1 Tax=Phytophthora citrophthora TaxID=4793 RepID=A0AAD9LDK8_9STRA|nr:Phosphoinositide phosphatase SAC1 [Phytophthora citrophthora]